MQAEEEKGVESAGMDSGVEWIALDLKGLDVKWKKLGGRLPTGPPVSTLQAAGHQILPYHRLCYVDNAQHSTLTSPDRNAQTKNKKPYSSFSSRFLLAV
jgi:hypothetical protein